MLKQYPTLRYVLQKGFWYLLTFIVAIAINFTLPRLGENNPVDIIMGKAAQGLSPEEAKKKKEGLLVSFGMAELNEDGSVNKYNGNYEILFYDKIGDNKYEIKHIEDMLMYYEIIIKNKENLTFCSKCGKPIFIYNTHKNRQAIEPICKECKI